jgi:23S rRNA pseudoU1915 N3-methylase RlmH
MPAIMVHGRWTCHLDHACGKVQAAAGSQSAQDRVIALDEGGRAVTSEGMARLIAEVRAVSYNMHQCTSGCW